MRCLWSAVMGEPVNEARHAAVQRRRGRVRQLEGPQPGGVDQRQPGQGVGVDAIDLAWRLRSRRRSWALAELTRYTVRPRAAKNTAIGSQAGPVGSTTTSRRVPAAAPASAACSTSPRLSTVWTGLRRHTRPPSPASTRTVRALVIYPDPDQSSVIHPVASLPLAVLACSGRSDGRR